MTDLDTPSRRHQIESLARELKPRLSHFCRVATNFFERRNFSKDLARIPPLMEKALFHTTPHLVVQPKDEHDIAEVLAFCKSKGLAVFPRGSGSSALGGAVPTRNGIVIDLSPMMAILDINPENNTCRVQSGARWADVASKLELYGLSLLTTPTSYFSTVGGWVSTGGMGLNSYSYGTVFESLLGLRVVRPDGNIEELDFESESIKELFGTEGQFGILTEITLRVRPKPSDKRIHLLTFDNPSQAFEFITHIHSSPHKPTHVVFFNAEYMKRENVLFSEQSKMKDPIVPEQDAVLLHFNNPKTEQNFLSSLNGEKNQISGNRISAHYLWSERYFPLKAQRIGPGLLGSEVVLSHKHVSRYIAKVKKIGRHFKVDLSVEVVVCRNGDSYSYLVIVSFGCDYSRPVHYALSLLLIQLLVKMAVQLGGHPYGIGIWNTPFVQSKYNQAQLDQLMERKHELDPSGTLNPHKFFKIKGRFFSLPALLLSPILFRLILAVTHALTPLIGMIAGAAQPKQPVHWDMPAKEGEHGRHLLHQCALRCTSCGSCLSVCPAYRITGDELVAGRTKLRMAEAMMNGVELESSEALSVFQCLHCGLCEEVCQTHLPLRDCYLVLEEWIENRFGSPTETVQRFVDKLDSNREFIKDIFGLDLPEWSPGEQFSRAPKVDWADRGEGN
jgi:FAD/FMN-containing dehydrogenase/ferredoxin